MHKSASLNLTSLQRMVCLGKLYESPVIQQSPEPVTDQLSILECCICMSIQLYSPAF